jgi:hypothetical protein
MIASCGGCHRQWHSTNEAHCATCHRHFGGVYGFDAHRRDGACVDPATLTDKAGNATQHVTQRVDGPVWLRGGTWFPIEPENRSEAVQP